MRVLFAWFRRVLTPLLPGVAATVCVFVLSDRVDGPHQVPAWLYALPYVLLTVAIVLGTLFRQSRMALIGLLLTAVVLRCGPEAPEAATATLRAVLLLPVWFVVCGFLGEQRLYSSAGAILLLITSAVAGMLFVPSLPALDDPLRALMSLAPSESWAAVSSLPVPALALCVVAGGALLMGRRWTGALLLQSLLLSFLALDARGPVFAEESSLFFSAGMSAAAFVLVCAVLAGAWWNAFIDELTGLPGRRAMNQHLASLGRRQALAVVDVDHFKKINDRHGHDVGDQVLRFIAFRLRAFRYGTAYRFGGEEFVVVLKRGEAKQHVERLNALREEIAAKRFVLRSLDRPQKKPHGARGKRPVGDRVIRVTVSIGMAMRSQACRTPGEILEAADKALYRAKRGGRNQVRK